ncbi:hypothetical protein CURE108131_19695 [Cupriavidus respiraculi]|uniref:Uncharacterized protein n=1 Tax=Cupriavidus respiraculi TaxID=195930 RepID=A0ABN7Z8C0_9BURK|nr:hypothetical protein LMG21510_04306 [Cupriavidus respiraculi]
MYRSQSNGLQRAAFSAISLRFRCYVRSENEIMAKNEYTRQAYFCIAPHFCVEALPDTPLRSRICGHASFM